MHIWDHEQALACAASFRLRQRPHSHEYFKYRSIGFGSRLRHRRSSYAWSQPAVQIQGADLMQSACDLFTFSRWSPSLMERSCACSIASAGSFTRPICWPAHALPSKPWTDPHSCFILLTGRTISNPSWLPSGLQRSALALKVVR